MKTVYTAVTARLKSKVKALRWIDLDTGQLERSPAIATETGRPALAYPCALVGITITRAEDITDSAQECEARIIIRLAFNSEMRTGAAAPASAAATSLKPYDIIADVYAVLQGWGTGNFDPLSRVSQQKESNSNGQFVYRIEFMTSFEDHTAGQ